MNMEKLLAQIEQNKKNAVLAYSSSEEESKQGHRACNGTYEPGTSKSSPSQRVGKQTLFLCLWKGKYAFIVNGRGDIAATLTFDDNGNWR